MGRVINQTKQQQQQQPCLFLFRELMDETEHAFLNPFKQTIRTFNYPELDFSSQCLSSRFGWLLLLSRQTSALFFFNPLTRVQVQLPYIRHYIDVAVFSAPPTSPNCVVVALHKQHRDYLGIDTLRIGASKWTKHADFGDHKAETKFDTPVQGVYSSDGHVYCMDSIGRIAAKHADFGDHKAETKFDTPVQGVYSSDGHVYCMDSIGRIAAFDVRTLGKCTWRILLKHKWRMLKDSVLFEDSKNGEILIGVRGNYGVFNGVYKLVVDQETKEAGLMKVERFGNGDKLFLGPFGSFVFSSKETDETKTQIVVGGYRSDLKCRFYDFDGANDWKEENALNCEQYSSVYTPIWIEPLE